jgi:hypothetical protein
MARVMLRPLDGRQRGFSVLALVALASCWGDVVLGWHGSTPDSTDPGSLLDTSAEDASTDEIGFAEESSDDTNDGSTTDDASLVESASEGDSPISCDMPLVAPAVHPMDQVIAVYLAASDTPEADRQVRRTYFDRALTALKLWFGESMGPTYPNQTFRVSTTFVLTSQYTHAQWDDFALNGYHPPDGSTTKCGLVDAAMDELGSGAHLGLLASAQLPPIATLGVFYVVLGGGGWTGGCGNSAVSVVEELVADRVRTQCPNGVYDDCARNCFDQGGLGDADPFCKQYPANMPGYGCIFVGSLAVHLGVGFGLTPSAERTAADQTACLNNTIMDAWWQYGHGVSLCEPDRRDLVGSMYFAAP